MTESKSADLLVELGCEELPPKALEALARAFFDGVCTRLDKAGFVFDAARSKPLFSPRRLSMRIADLSARQPDRELERKGPALKAAFDADGKPTPAAEGFARSVGKTVEELETLSTDKGEWLYCRVMEKGQALDGLLFEFLQQSLDALPVPKPMRWSDHEYSFVRPVHWLVVLHGDRLVEGELFGHAAGRHSRGHRIHHPQAVTINDAGAYEAALEAARVLVDPVCRVERIRDQVTGAGQRLGGVTRVTDALLAEVCNLVEWPVAIECTFEPDFLSVPQEALIASMEDHQKFFPVLDAPGGRLTSDFVAVANLESRDPAAVRAGFERVIRPRLADARFFWEQDRKRALAQHQVALDGIVFQEKLGSIGDKSKRNSVISEKIAEFLSLDPEAATRSAALAKCDLVSQMVGEFPELQGTMGAYYAEASGEATEVALAIGEHYSPRFSGDALPTSPLGRVLALADRLDTLIGIFAAGQKPSGNKDPFALRRAALGIVRLLSETDMDIELDRLLAVGANALSDRLEVPPALLGEVRGFILERARQYYRDQGKDTRLVNAALEAPLGSLLDFRSRLEALAHFMQTRSAEALVAANKRIGNILRKSDNEISQEISEDLLKLAEERQLFEEIIRLESILTPLYKAGDYGRALEQLSTLDQVIEPFFDKVMVMDENPAIRDNRLALLGRLKALFDRVADLSQAG